jgi:single-stranded-DNA-specific exonuclease
MKTWLEPQEVVIPTGLQSAIGGHPLVSEVLLRRGFSDLDTIQHFLDPDLYIPASPYELSGMHLAVDRLVTAIQDGESICVWGDFDVDGQTSTTVLVSSLAELGGKVTFHIPVREVESHGVNLPALREVIASGIDLLLTCDTGISAHEAVAFANSKGVNVIISDHHDPPAALPGALAVINPKLGPPDHPLSALPGVGVAFKLAEALHDRLGGANNADDYLDLVALGIVADLAYQVRDVRYLLQRGLTELHQTRRLGLQIMMELAEIDPSGLTEEHIGFELGPRLNALGRLADANLAVELLTTKDKSRGRILATQLEGLNAERKLLTGQVFQAAQAQIERDPSLLDHAALVLAHEAWPGGVIGIVASRLVDRYDCPVLLIASPDGELARGSARSIPGVNISAAIAVHQQILESFGGHPMAAGFALPRDRIPEFREALSETVAQMISEAHLEPTLTIDGHLPLSELSLELVSDLERLAPFGPGNSNLVLVDRNLHLVTQKPLGRTGEHLQMIFEDEYERSYKAVWWGGGIEQLPEWLVSGASFDLAYTARSRDFRGTKELQIEWLEAHPREAPSIEVTTRPREVAVHDHRGANKPLSLLKEIYDPQRRLVWAEAGAQGELSEVGIHSCDRYSLSPMGELVIWTSPPSIQDLHAALEVVEPEIVHLFAVDPGTDRLEDFLRRLSGLVRYALRANQGQVSLAALAAGTAQLEVTARLGIDWLVAGGHLELGSSDGDKLSLVEGDWVKKEGLRSISDDLKSLLVETAAFRAFYSRADVDLIINP